MIWRGEFRGVCGGFFQHALPQLKLRQAKFVVQAFHHVGIRFESANSVLGPRNQNRRPTARFYRRN